MGALRIDSAPACARVRTATWRTWTGRSDCPPEPNATPVSVLFRNGDVEQGYAGDYSWRTDHSPDGWEPDDIVAYRVRDEARA